MKTNKLPLLFLIFFTGNFGIHRFYLKSYKLGSLYILFSFTRIPALIALIELVYFAFQSEEQIRLKYPERASTRIMLLVGVLTFIAFWVMVVFLIKGFRIFNII